ncbi:DnaB-like helicase C-terminal domain-containing protein [Vulcanococcus limneticus]|uniref:DnaB-like helicase C-terminal domain-containing protein n=1 Tax=Vulcanococcus limneticus TaxID=2170428 RepID=UPI000B99ACB2|nr:DnaB-like helicase C-terminal domain-containing protein [Vulcanococcus limneticus]MCP9793579.1 helicase DnaB [Vulcanococcus limneticus MW73D5]
MTATPSTAQIGAIPGGFDPALVQSLIEQGVLLETAAGLVATEAPVAPPPEGLVEHEKNLLAAVLIGSGDQRERWGQFRRAIGLRFDEGVPASLWSDPGHRALALEIDALFRGRRDIAVLNANALREDLQQRAADGRFQGSLQQIETALSEVIAWGEDGQPHPELEFTLACQLFQSAKARALFYPGLRRLLAREQVDHGIDAELEHCRDLLNEATAITAGRFRRNLQLCSAVDAARECIALASLPAEQRPRPISTGIPSLDIDMRGGILPGTGESTWVLAARSGIGKTTVAIAAAMGLAINGASVLVLSCELSRRAIGARLLSSYCRRAAGQFNARYGANDLEGRGAVIEGRDLDTLQQLSAQFSEGLAPNGDRMGQVLYQSQFAATVEQLAALVEDCKSAHPELAAVVLDHFHAMGPTPGYGSNTTAELAARATAIKALAGRCELDVVVVAQLNRGAYGNTTGPDVSHLAGTSELERYASAVWLIDRPRLDEFTPARPGVLEVHHGKCRHGQMAAGLDLSKTTIRLDRSHCYLEADEARKLFTGSDLYPGVECL